ncbi:type I restriction endonuclease subunit R [Streptomyces prasinopilosus]|uniref:Type I restriction enzyme endonuclease subunit n=1 Tax=Streptomyces prasinopilosus TaxID=67344 RepID=A0A1G6VY03_9ACTN|nr:type I restriction endonuclease subunit R [Streptomyces prasinopilosus]SDD58512.1 type I restriction enzyme, R subunit [Streptomyces prasinopilosus]
MSVAPDEQPPPGSEAAASHAEALTFSEKDWEHTALEQLAEFGWLHVDGKDLGPAHGHRTSWDDLILYPRLRTAIATRYPHLPETAVTAAIDELLKQSPGSDVRQNWLFYRRLTMDAVKVSYRDPLTDTDRHETVRVVDFANPHGNDLVAASQVRVRSTSRGREFVFDIVLYVNGLPLGIIELKKASGPDDSRKAYDQIRNYRRELRNDGVFRTLLLAVATDGITARLGTPFTPWQHMAPWHADEDGTLLRKKEWQDGRALERMIQGPLEPGRFLDLIGSYLSYSAEGTGADVDTVKLAKAHQYFAVREAVAATESAAATDGRAGVVWHTQGAGKSEEMLFYAGKVARTPKLSNPTILLLTDRIDLDTQLFGTFARSHSLHRITGEPDKAYNAKQLKDLLTRGTSGGGVVFSTLQKFRVSPAERKAGARHPVISPRHDVIVIVDEAHRSHYDFEDGFARNLRDALPHATFIAFTGTPIDNATGSTEGVFGPTIHTYDLTQAVDDGATVPVYYEAILHKVKLKADLPDDVDLDDLDAQAEGLVEGLTEAEQKRARRRFGAFEDLIGAPERIEELAKTVLDHWDTRRTEMIKLTGRPGKGMIVCSSRAIAARLFEAIARRRPEWAGERDPVSGLYPDDTGKVRVVFTGNPGHEDDEVADYVRTPTQLKRIQKRVVDREEKDELELIIVQSLWLTGFDAPPLHTLYLDRRMRGAALMQAVARVNRTWGEKPSGLVVDFLGVAQELTEALGEYTPRDQENRTIGAPVEEACASVRRTHQRIGEVLRPCPWRTTLDAHGYKEALYDVLEFLKEAEPDLEPGKPTRHQLFMHHAQLLSRSFSLCSTHPDVQDLLPDIRFYSAVRTSRQKLTADDRRIDGLATEADVNRLVRQLNAEVVAADGVVDIYDAAGLTKPDLSHLGEDFVAQMRASRHPNLAIEALRRAIKKEIRDAHPGNVVRQRTFTEKMQAVMNRYHNGLLSSAEVMDLLVDLARTISADRERAKELGLTEDELAFYDAVADNPSALELGQGVLSEIAHKLCELVRKDVTVDWRVKGQARDRIRGKVKLLLRLYGYPPDQAPDAIDRVLKQTEVKADEWT